jgi:hypothetical protein
VSISDLEIKVRWWYEDGTYGFLLATLLLVGRHRGFHIYSRCNSYHYQRTDHEVGLAIFITTQSVPAVDHTVRNGP